MRFNERNGRMARAPRSRGRFHRIALRPRRTSERWRRFLSLSLSIFPSSYIGVRIILCHRVPLTVNSNYFVIKKNRFSARDCKGRPNESSRKWEGGWRRTEKERERERGKDWGRKGEKHTQRTREGKRRRRRLFINFPPVHPLCTCLPFPPIKCL